MNSMEERARAAVQATASEIGPDDVPPMRSLGSGDASRGPGAGSRHWREGSGSARGAGRRAVWQWGAPLAAAAAVVAVVAGAVTLGGVSHSPASHPAVNSSKAAATPAKPAPRKPAAPGYPANLRAGLIGNFLPASGAQYSAGAQLNGEYQSLEGKITAKCMVRLGFPAPQTLSPAQIARGDWDLSQYPDLNAIAKAGTLPSYSFGPTPPRGKAYQRALNHCAMAGQQPFEPMLSAARKLEGPFMGIVSQIETSTQVTATTPVLRACAKRYGWPNDPYGPTRPMSSFGDFVDWVAGHIDGAGSRGASAAKMNNLNRHWGTVFVTCARPTVAVMEKLQLTAQTKFLAMHQRQFAALVKLARDDFTRAQRLARG